MAKCYVTPPDNRFGYKNIVQSSGIRGIVNKLYKSSTISKVEDFLSNMNEDVKKTIFDYAIISSKDDMTFSKEEDEIRKISDDIFKQKVVLSEKIDNELDAQKREELIKEYNLIHAKESAFEVLETSHLMESKEKALQTLLSVASLENESKEYSIAINDIVDHMNDNEEFRNNMRLVIDEIKKTYGKQFESNKWRSQNIFSLYNGFWSVVEKFTAPLQFSAIKDIPIFTSTLEKFFDIKGQSNQRLNEFKYRVDEILSGAMASRFKLNFEVSKTGTSEYSDGKRLINDTSKYVDNKMQILTKSALAMDLSKDKNGKNENAIRRIVKEIRRMQLENRYLEKQSYGNTNIAEWLAFNEKMVAWIEDESKKNIDDLSESERKNLSSSSNEEDIIALYGSKVRNLLKEFVGKAERVESGFVIKKGVINQSIEVIINGTPKTMSASRYSGIMKIESMKQRVKEKIAKGESASYTFYYIPDENVKAYLDDIDKLNDKLSKYTESVFDISEAEDTITAVSEAKKQFIDFAKERKKIQRKHSVKGSLLKEADTNKLLKKYDVHANEFYFPHVRADVGIVYNIMDELNEDNNFVDSPFWIAGNMKGRKWRSGPNVTDINYALGSYIENVINSTYSTIALNENMKLIHYLQEFDKATKLKYSNKINNMIKYYTEMLALSWDGKLLKRMDGSLEKRWADKNEFTKTIANAYIAFVRRPFFSYVMGPVGAAWQQFGMRFRGWQQTAYEERFGIKLSQMIKNENDNQPLKIFGIDIGDHREFTEWLAVETGTWLSDTHKEFERITKAGYDDLKDHYLNDSILKMTDTDLKLMSSGWIQDLTNAVARGDAAFINAFLKSLYNLHILKSEDVSMLGKFLTSATPSKEIKFQRVWTKMSENMSFQGATLSSRRWIVERAFLVEFARERSRFEAIMKDSHDPEFNFDRDATIDMRRFISKKAIAFAKKQLIMADGAMLWENKPLMHKYFPSTGVLKLWAFTMTFQTLNDIVKGMGYKIGTVDGYRAFKTTAIMLFAMNYHNILNALVDDEYEQENFLFYYLSHGYVPTIQDTIEKLNKGDYIGATKNLRSISPLQVAIIWKFMQWLDDKNQDIFDLPNIAFRNDTFEMLKSINEWYQGRPAEALINNMLQHVLPSARMPLQAYEARKLKDQIISLSGLKYEDMLLKGKIRSQLNIEKDTNIDKIVKKLKDLSPEAQDKTLEDMKNNEETNSPDSPDNLIKEDENGQ